MQVAVAVEEQVLQRVTRCSPGLLCRPPGRGRRKARLKRKPWPAVPPPAPHALGETGVTMRLTPEAQAVGAWEARFQGEGLGPWEHRHPAVQRTCHRQRRSWSSRGLCGRAIPGQEPRSTTALRHRLLKPRGSLKRASVFTDKCGECNCVSGSCPARVLGPWELRSAPQCGAAAATLGSASGTGTEIPTSAHATGPCSAFRPREPAHRL